MSHGIMHHRRQEPGASSVLPSSIGFSGINTGTADTSTGFASDHPLTTATFSHSVVVTSAGSTFTTAVPTTYTAHDSSALSSIQSLLQTSTSAGATTASSTQASASATNSTSTSSKSSNNLGTLLPAIVVPISAFLVISFIVFWLVMRRKHKKRLEQEPEFVMANKEKIVSRGSSHRSDSSLAELVPLSKLEQEKEKSTKVRTTEVTKTSPELSPPKYTSNIGVARPMTPPDKAAVSGTVMKDFAAATPKAKSTVPNFSSRKPSIGRRKMGSQETKTSPESRQSMTALTQPAQAFSSTRGRNGPANNPVSRSPQRNGPPAINTSLNVVNHASQPKSLSPLTPTGAYNGASAISQYSPLVKESPTGGLMTLPSLPTHHNDTGSPTDDNVLSKENVRIARLANSSRLGFSHSPVEASFPSRNVNKPLSPLSENIPQNTKSPQLPPPLSRDDDDSNSFTKSFVGSSIYPSPSMGMNASANSLSQSHHVHRASVVSRISSEDEYVDAHADDRSDISSLDERDRIEPMTSDRLGTIHGSGNASNVVNPVTSTASSAGNGARAEKKNLRERDSEGPFALSKY